MYMSYLVHIPNNVSFVASNGTHTDRDFSDALVSLEELEKDNLGKFLFQSAKAVIFQTATDYIYKYVDLSE